MERQSERQQTLQRVIRISQGAFIRGPSAWPPQKEAEVKLMRLPNIICHRWLSLVVACSLSLGASADEGQAFRVCADPNNLPFSAKTKDGLENRIADLWAHKLGLPLEYTWFPQRRGFVRNTLKAANASGDGYKCDIVMGVAAGVDSLLTTTPYYRSTYAWHTWQNP